MFESFLPALDTQGTFSISTVFYVYLAGVITSFTPCVYPLIPITLSLFGATADAPTKKRVFLAILYCGGIATTYTLLGILSAQTGMVFGSLLANPFLILFIVAVLCLLALSSLDLFRLPGLQQLQNRASELGSAGPGGAFIMGCVSGIVAAPCVSPVLAGVLLIAAEGKNVLWGGGLLFTYAMGISTIFLLLAAFSGLLNRIPRSGNWLFVVKFFIASALFGVMYFFSQPLLGSWFDSIALAIPRTLLFLALISVLFLARISFKKNIQILKAASSLVVGFVCFLLIFGNPMSNESGPSSSVTWYTDSSTALTEGSSRKRVTMIDVFADWCAACKELEHKTFPSPLVQEQLKRMVVARVDYADEEALVDRYAILGLPCILFIDATGKEIKDSRIDGFIPSEAFAKHIQQVLEH